MNKFKNIENLIYKYFFNSKVMTSETSKYIIRYCNVCGKTKLIASLIKHLPDCDVGKALNDIKRRGKSI